jgi:hypothetical protein
MVRPQFGQAKASDMPSACKYQRYTFKHGGVKVSIENYGRARPVNGT